jgi:hypothetical protein
MQGIQPWPRIPLYLGLGSIYGRWATFDTGTKANRALPR